MRRAALIGGLGLVLALAAARGGGASSAGAYLLVRPDPRMCPSPLCGGMWVHRVNHATTRCLDGSMRRECYVASAGRATGNDDLVLGTIVPAQIDAFPELARLAVRRRWPAVVAAPALPATVYRVADTGIRCVAAPCFSLRAARLETTRTVMLSELDLEPLDLPPAARERALRRLTRGGLLVSGTVAPVSRAGPAGDGRALRARQVWLPAAG